MPPCPGCELCTTSKDLGAISMAGCVRSHAGTHFDAAASGDGLRNTTIGFYFRVHYQYWLR